MAPPAEPSHASGSEGDDTCPDDALLVEALTAFERQQQEQQPPPVSTSQPEPTRQPPPSPSSASQPEPTRRPKRGVACGLHQLTGAGEVQAAAAGAVRPEARACQALQAAVGVASGLWHQPVGACFLQPSRSSLLQPSRSSLHQPSGASLTSRCDDRCRRTTWRSTCTGKTCTPHC